MSKTRRQAAENLKGTLLDALDDFIDVFLEEPGKGAQGAELADHRKRLAAAVLVFEITRADFQISEDERIAIWDSVQQTFRLSPGETDQLMRSASAQAERAPRLHEYAAFVDHHCSHEQKLGIVESLWKVAFADAELVAHEEYLVRKIANLLHLSTADLIEAKIKAREAFR